MFEKNSENYYSQEGKTLVETLEGDFSINNVFNPINLGAKWKLLISRFQNSLDVTFAAKLTEIWEKNWT